MGAGQVTASNECVTMAMNLQSTKPDDQHPHDTVDYIPPPPPPHFTDSPSLVHQLTVKSAFIKCRLRHCYNLLMFFSRTYIEG